MNTETQEFELVVELTQKEVLRVLQLLTTLLQKKNTKLYQDKVTELTVFLDDIKELIKHHDDPEFDVQQAFVTKLDQFLQPEKWVATPLLQASGEQLKKIRAKLSELDDSKRADLQEARAVALAAQRANMVQVFISLYQADGYNLKKWAALLEMVGDLSTSRPVYQSESDVVSVIHAKEHKQNEGYAAVYLSPNGMLAAAPGQAMQDKSGHNLVFVKERALKPEHILYFEHVTGRYVLSNGTLIKQR